MSPLRALRPLGPRRTSTQNSMCIYAVQVASECTRGLRPGGGSAGSCGVSGRFCGWAFACNGSTTNAGSPGSCSSFTGSASSEAPGSAFEARARCMAEAVRSRQYASSPAYSSEKLTAGIAGGIGGRDLTGKVGQVTLFTYVDGIYTHPPVGPPGAPGHV